MAACSGDANCINSYRAQPHCRPVSNTFAHMMPDGGLVVVAARNSRWAAWRQRGARKHKTGQYINVLDSKEHIARSSNRASAPAQFDAASCFDCIRHRLRLLQLVLKYQRL